MCLPSQEGISSITVSSQGRWLGTGSRNHGLIQGDVARQPEGSFWGGNTSAAPDSRAPAAPACRIPWRSRPSSSWSHTRPHTRVSHPPSPALPEHPACPARGPGGAGTGERSQVPHRSGAGCVGCEGGVSWPGMYLGACGRWAGDVALGSLLWEFGSQGAAQAPLQLQLLPGQGKREAVSTEMASGARLTGVPGSHGYISHSHS